MIRFPPFLFRLKRRLRRPGTKFAALQVVIALVGGVLVTLALDGARRPAAVVEPRTAVPVAEAGSAKTVARTNAAAAEQAMAQPLGDLSHLATLDVPPPLRSLDGTSFLRRDLTIHLHGVEGPRARDVCLDATGGRWGCGVRARAALHNLAGGKPMSCQPRRAISPTEMEADCFVEGAEGAERVDVARFLVAEGWARPAGGGAAYGAEAAQAQAAARGLWQGGWRLVSTLP